MHINNIPGMTWTWSSPTTPEAQGHPTLKVLLSFEKIKVNIKVRVNVKVHRRCVKHLHIANSSLGCNLSAQVSTFCDIKRRPTTKYQVVEALDSNILDVIKVL